jgi:hypothetical protein
LKHQEREKLDKLAVQRYCMSKEYIEEFHRQISEKVMSVMEIRDKTHQNKRESVRNKLMSEGT